MQYAMRAKMLYPRNSYNSYASTFTSGMSKNSMLLVLGVCIGMQLALGTAINELQSK
jgi:hypothetical protein